MSAPQGPFDQQAAYGAPTGAPGTRPWYAQWYIWVAVAAVLVGGATIFGAVSLLGGGGESDPAGAPATSESPADPPSEASPGGGADAPGDGADGNAPGAAQELAMGESAALNDDWTVSIDDAVMDATEDLVANQNPEPPEGTVYATVSLTATNTGDEPAQMYNSITVAYVGADGTPVVSSAAIAEDDAYLLSQTPPGKTDTGTYVFEVPAGSEGGYWVVQVGGEADPRMLAFANE